MRNASSAKAQGPAFTKVLAGWFEDGFVAGPFMSPPLPEFRANSIMFVEQKTKVRPILNMSYPEGDSYNNNVDKLAVPKVRMSSAKQFGQSVLKAGTGALMSKMDMKDAYKNVPAKVEDLRLQGFSWLGAYVEETQLIFSASPAVANFDNLGGTTEDITLTHCSIPEDLVHRILDDTVCVAPAWISMWMSDRISEILSSEILQASLLVSNWIPRTVPLVLFVKAFSCLGHSSASLMLSWWQILL